MIYIECLSSFDDTFRRRRADIEFSQSHHSFPLSQIRHGDPEQQPQFRLPSLVPGYISSPGQIRPELQSFKKYAAKARPVHLSASSIIIIILGAPISPAERLVLHDTITICKQYARNVLDPSILQVLKDLVRKLPPTMLAYPLPTTPRTPYSFLPGAYLLNRHQLVPLLSPLRRPFLFAPRSP